MLKVFQEGEDMPDEPKTESSAESAAAPEPHRPPGSPDTPAETAPAAPPAAAEDPGKIMGIIGLVLIFFFPLAGLIVCLIAWNKSKKAGFKNVPALIGIFLNLAFILLSVLITILLVVASFKGVQHTAKMTEQAADVNYLSAQLERYYADRGTLPDKLDDLKQMTGFDTAALDPPQGLKPYQYAKQPDGCSTNCTGYKITARHEDGTTYDHTGSVGTAITPTPDPSQDNLRPIEPDRLQEDSSPVEEF